MVLSAALFASASLVLGLDHVPVAVRDLEGAVTLMKQMGFSVKPGRDHGNSVRNAHVKFEDGTEIELITASLGVDRISRGYMEFLSRRDGPAYVCLYVHQPVSAMGERAMGVRLVDQAVEWPGGIDQIFFGQRNWLASDPEWVTRHENGGKRLAAVWFSGIVQEGRDFWERVGESVSERSPFFYDGALFRVGSGFVGDLGRGREPRMVGVTVEVDSFAETRTYLEKGEWDLEIRGNSVVVKGLMGGMFIEFWQEG